MYVKKCSTTTRLTIKSKDFTEHKRVCPLESPCSANLVRESSTVFHLALIVHNASYLDAHLVSHNFLSLVRLGSPVSELAWSNSRNKCDVLQILLNKQQLVGQYQTCFVRGHFQKSEQ